MNPVAVHAVGRELTGLGHTPRLVPPQYVKPYVKRGKNIATTPRRVCDDAGRPGMHFVPVKSITQQAQGMVLKVREIPIGQRTALGNTVRGHAAEFGIAVGKGLARSHRCYLLLNKRPPSRRKPKRCSLFLVSKSKNSVPGSKKSMPN